MALTKVSTDGVKDDAITKAKIPANQIEASELADNSVDSAALSADCVIGSKIADSQIATEHIVDEAVTLAKLPHGDANNDGKFLRANNGADPSFESLPASGVSVSNNADNRVITGDGTNLNAEANFTYDGTYLNYTANVNHTYPSGTETNYMEAKANNNGIKYIFRGDGLYLGNGLTGSNQGSGPSNTKIHLGTNGTIKSGAIEPTANNTFDLGSASLRWANIYTNDLNLSNKGSSNDVDGTWGDWTIQEGESDLFLKNNRSGKKYKFNLTEVS
jgi:hypothetical protein